MRGASRFRLSLLALGILYVIPAAALAQPFVAQPLVAPDGFTTCQALAANPNGVVVGFCGPWGKGFRAVVWRDGVPQALPLPTGYLMSSFAQSVNESGTIVGGCSSPETQVGCLWTAAGTVQVLPTPAGQSSTAQDVNSSGLVAGMIGNRAVVWTPSGVLSLPDSEQYLFSEARAINDSGVVAVRFGTSDPSVPSTTARWWTDTGVVLALPIPSDHTPWVPSDINSFGDVVGMVFNSAGLLRPVLWLNGLPQLLSVSGVGAAGAVGINDSLDVSGFAETPDIGRTAALWPQAGAIVSFVAGPFPGGKPSATANYINNARVAAGSVNGVATLFAPQTAAQAAEQIAQEIQSLIDDGAIQTRDAAALESQISAAVTRIADGNNQAAVGVLTAFNNRVAALVNAGRLTQTDADNLVAASNALIDRLN